MSLTGEKPQNEIRYDGCIRVNVEWEFENSQEFFQINVNESRTIEDLIKVVIIKLGSKYYGIKPQYWKIFKGSRILLNEYTLEEWDIVDEDTVLMQAYSDKIIDMIEEENTENSLQKNLINLDLVNGLNVKDYYTEPDFTTIVRMDEEEARHVENFTIGNKYGKVIWEGYTDILNVLKGRGNYNFDNLSEVISINYSSLTVYEDEDKKPNEGEALNKPAFVYLYDLYPPALKKKLKDSTILNREEVAIFEKFKNKLREIVRMNGGVFLSYKGNIGEFCFSVSGF